MSKVDSSIASGLSKPDMSQLILKACIGEVRVASFGNAKHGAGNFLAAAKDLTAPNRYAAKVLRHLANCQANDGTYDFTRLDAESGLPEIDHILRDLRIIRAFLIEEGSLPADPGPGKEVK